MRKSNCILASALLLAAANTSAQEKKEYAYTAEFFTIENCAIPMAAISDNGRYITGGYQGSSFVFDTETRKISVPPNEAGTLGNTYMDNLKDVSDFGRAVGNHEDGIPAIWENDKWEILPTLDGRLAYPNAITAHGDTIAGGIELKLKAGVMNPGLPCIWVLEENKWRLELLPCPNETLLGDPLARTFVQTISSDGKRLFGRIVDTKLGNYGCLITWEKQDGDWKYTKLGEEFVFDFSAENPGSTPKMSDYVTAEPNTPEYDEQVKYYQNVVLVEWREGLKKFYRQSHFDVTASSNAASPDGMRMMGTLKDLAAGTTSPIVFDMTNEAKAINYGELIPGGANGWCANDGTLIFDEMSGTPSVNSLILLPGATETITVPEYIMQRSGSDFTDDITALNAVTGRPQLSADGNTLAAWVGCGQFLTGATANYYVKFKPTPNSLRHTDQSEAARYTNGTLHLSENVVETRIFALSSVQLLRSNEAEISLSQFGRGVYIAHITLANGTLQTLKLVVE